MKDSVFAQLNQLINAGYLQSPLGPVLQASTGIEKAKKLLQELEFDDDFDPPTWRAYEDIMCLVKQGNKYVGHVSFGPFAGDDFDDFEIEKVEDVMEPIPPNPRIPSNTTLLELVELFTSSTHNWFFVLDGAKITGIVGRDDLFYNPSFSLSLLGLILELEQAALELAKTKLTESWQALPERRKDEAQRVLEGRKGQKRSMLFSLYRRSTTFFRALFQFAFWATTWGQGKISRRSEHEPLRQLLACTMLCDKATILAKLRCIPDWTPKKIRSAFGNAEKIRNALCHTNPEENDPLLPYQEILFPLIQEVHKLIAIIKATLELPPPNILLG